MHTKRKGPKASPYVFELTELGDGILAGEFSSASLVGIDLFKGD